MIQVFTQKILVRYVYNELPPDTRRELEAALRHDAALAELCAELLVLNHAFDGALLQPASRTTAAILAAARRPTPENP